MNNEQELLRCPFCGGKAELAPSGKPRVEGKPHKVKNYYVCCGKCDLYMGYDCDYEGQFKTVEEAISAWNRRTPGVVHCEDCKCFEPVEGNCNQFEHLCSEDDFCGWAVKKDEVKS